MSSPSFAEVRRGGESGPRRVALLGSTGSIGRQTIDVLEAHPDAFRVTALATGSNGALLAEQSARLRPAAVALADEAASAALDLPGGTDRVGGTDALEALATRDDVDLVIVATGGVVSLRPVLAALRAGKIVATANKETLVAGGHLVMPLARELANATAATDPGDPYASPLAWLATDKWLQGFAYRIPVHAWVFPLAGIGVITLAFGTVSYHALRAAAMNPAKSLKTE